MEFNNIQILVILYLFLLVGTVLSFYGNSKLKTQRKKDVEKKFIETTTCRICGQRNYKIVRLRYTNKWEMSDRYGYPKEKTDTVGGAGVMCMNCRKYSYEFVKDHPGSIEGPGYPEREGYETTLTDKEFIDMIVSSNRGCVELSSIILQWLLLFSLLAASFGAISGLILRIINCL